MELASAPQMNADAMRQLLAVPDTNDTFFQEEPGLIAVFDYDYDLIVDYYTKVRWAQFAFFPPAWISALACYPCFLGQNVKWDRRSQHVALTVDGIKYVHDKRQRCWGLHCCDGGKESKTVPYDKITDCDVHEPAGTACCCCIDRVLHTVHVDTASSGVKDGVPSHELVLDGLREPHAFKQAVWAMKRGQRPAGAVPDAQGVALSAPGQQDMSVPLLREIRDELRSLNTTLAKR